MNMYVACSFDTPITNYVSTSRHVTDELNLYKQLRQDHKSRSS